MSDGKSRDIITMAALAAFAVMIGAVGLLTGREIEKQLLASSAGQQTGMWLQEFADPLAIPRRLAEGRSLYGLVGPGSIGTGPHINRLRLFDAKGGLVAFAQRLPAPPVVSLPVEPSLMQRALAGERVIRPFGGGTDGSTHALILTPVEHDGSTVGVAELLLDQTDEFARYRATAKKVAAGLALLLLLAIGVPSGLVWRRTRDRRKAESRLDFLTRHDALTGLPNRAGLADHLTRLLGEGGPDRRAGALLHINVDRFKTINDSLGHAAGDEVLRSIAGRLENRVRGHDLVARVAADEFVLLADGFAEAPGALRLAERVREFLAAPHAVDGRAVALSVSVGIAFYPEDGSDAATVMRHADYALRQARGEGGGICFFDERLADALDARRQLEDDLRKAIDTGEGLHLAYQPQYDLASGELTGFEALARWTHPTLGEIRPCRFIPIAEETGLILPLGAWIMRRACRDALSFPGGVKVAVNLSPVQFRRGQAADLVAGTLAETGLDASRLEVEITENLLLTSTEPVVEQLRRLETLGVGIAMDDFGTGYSSLSYLTRFRFSKIKIDRSFIQGVGRDPQLAAIVTAVVGLGRSLGVTITAEGVETEAQIAFLRRTGCDEVQGFFYGRPMPAAEAVRLTGMSRAEASKVA